VKLHKTPLIHSLSYSIFQTQIYEITRSNLGFLLFGNSESIKQQTLMLPIVVLSLFANTCS